MAADETKKFVENLNSNKSEFLAVSRVVSGAEETDSDSDSNLIDLTKGESDEDNSSETWDQDGTRSWKSLSLKILHRMQTL